MEGKPLHYDGSTNGILSNSQDQFNEALLLTEEMRKNIGGNPFEIHIGE